MSKRYHIDLSQPQHTDLGRLLYRYYYGTTSDLVKKQFLPCEYSGYPHNGGEHTLTLNVSPVRLADFFYVLNKGMPADQQLVNQLKELAIEKAMVSWSDEDLCVFNQRTDERAVGRIEDVQVWLFDTQSTDWFRPQKQLTLSAGVADTLTYYSNRYRVLTQSELNLTVDRLLNYVK